MKKLFKDVIGELKNPSEDAGKVLDVIRRVIRVALFMSMLFYIISIVWGASEILYMYKEGYLSDHIKYSEQGLFGLVFPYAKVFLRLMLNIILFIFSNKSIKTGKLVKSKVFLATIIALFVLLLTSFRFNFSSILGFFIQLTITTAIFGIIYFAFWDIENKESPPMELDKKRVYRISIIGYTLLIIHLIQRVISLLWTIIFYLPHFRDMRTYTGVGIREWLVVIALVLNTGVFSSLIALLVYSLIGRKKELPRIRKKANLLIVMFFVSILACIFEYFILDGGYLYFIVFALAVSYQNKYKLFDNLATRIFKRTTQAIKNGFTKYLSFKE